MHSRWEFFDEMEEIRLFLILFTKDVEEPCFDFSLVCKIFGFGDHIYKLIDDLLDYLLELNDDSYVAILVEVFYLQAFEDTKENLEDP
jgi:hypothetical protein